MASTAAQILVRSVNVGSRPTAPAKLPLRSNPYAKIKYKIKADGIRTLRNPELRLIFLLWAARITRQPIARQTLEVALLERFRSQSVIPMREKFTKRIHLV